MIAERKRRGEFIKSEGIKASTNIAAEGKKKEALTIGVAEQEAMRKISEGNAQATVLLATAEKTAMEVVTSAIGREGTSLMQYYLTNMYLDMFSRLRSRGVFFLGFEPNTIMGVLHRNVPRSFGLQPAPRQGLLYQPVSSTAPNAATIALANLLSDEGKKDGDSANQSGATPLATLAVPSGFGSSTSSAPTQFAGLD